MNLKFIHIVIITLAAVTFGYFGNVGHGLEWLRYDTPEDFLTLLLRLLFLSLLVERILEFYVMLYRSPERKNLEQELSEYEKSGETEKVTLLNTTIVNYKSETRLQTAKLGFLIGAIMAILGIRVFTGMFEFQDASALQIIFFDIFEVMLMGALMAGGSKGINKIVSAVEGFAKPKQAPSSLPNTKS